MSNYKLPLTEDLDFHYLLEIMPAIRNIEEYSWLPELFSIIGVESLLLLCKYAGGETIKIPTIDELKDSVTALQIFYSVYIEHSKDELSIPSDFVASVNKIKEVFYAEDTPESD